MARPIAKKTDMEEAAIHLSATKGLARTTIKDIAREARASNALSPFKKPF